MYELSAYITLDKEAIKSPNLCDRFVEDDLLKIGQWAGACYEQDLQSRTQWHERNQQSLDLAMQVQEAKSFPWDGCSNIIFPLITIAALQFHARAYPTIVSGNDIVKCRVLGQDPEGIEKVRADKISQHMSWQVMEQDECWEEETDRSLLNVAIVGCGFKKSYYDGSKGHNVSTYVHAKDLVFDYWAKTIDSAVTKTHIIPMYRNEIHSRVKSGQFRDVLDEAWYVADAHNMPTRESVAQDHRAGTDAPQTNANTPYIICEQHCWLDLDDDGYEEPYIVTFEESTCSVLRIVCRFDREEDIKRNTDGEIISINAWEYFTKIPFIPSPDGSMMDIGFGTLLGPLNDSVNSAINQLFDAGTLSNTAGGFLGRGAKIRGGAMEFQPFGWNRVDATGDDLRKSIFPLPVREPSAVMFQLLGLIIDFTNRVSGATDINVGENPGQNTPAETSRSMVEQGQKIYSAIFKRIWRSMKGEFKKLYQLNSVHLPSKVSFGAEGFTIGREDYSGSPAGVVPAADPSITSQGERYARAMAVKQLSVGNPAYNPDAVEIEVLKALGVTDYMTLYAGVANAPEPAPDVKLQIQQMKTQVEMAKLENARMEFVMTLQETVRTNSAKIEHLNAQVFKLYEDGKNVSEKQKIDAFRAGMEFLREQNKASTDQINRLMEIGKDAAATVGPAGAGTVPPVEGSSGNSAGLSRTLAPI